MSNFLSQKARKLFVDSVRISVRAGTGGSGLPQYGGIGGKGGDVYVQATMKKTSLAKLLNESKGGIFQASNGEPAKRTRLLGESGMDRIIKVPVGISVTDSDRQHVGDLNKAGDKVLLALGGRGGDKHNDGLGYVGQRRQLRLDLKLISDTVFVGFPNAGKSSLLNAISNATPKVANYPFTTLRPYLGMVKYNDFRSITFADLPGLVEGAHKNLGLGHEFLKHIVRSQVLLFVIDVDNVDLGPDYPRRTPLETLCILIKEIELYDDTLMKKPAIVAMTKMDTLKDAPERFQKFKEQLKALQEDPLSVEVDESIRPKRMMQFDEILAISSKTRYHLDDLRHVVRDVIDKYAEAETFDENDGKTFKDLQLRENNRLI
ncbi:uncharacterized protein LOC143868504 [Tasmannia lanceolata]|uniref:uncharacterized protein LOC143868504 n=1 Tax=Tasmannia lanceolata TaxID=3420 RepID=UPI0040649046